jgi:hypothetical protein
VPCSFLCEISAGEASFSEISIFARGVCGLLQEHMKIVGEVFELKIELVTQE